MIDNGDIPPKLISDLIQYEQLKDEMSGLFLSSPGVDQDVMSQSEVDEIFEWLKRQKLTMRRHGDLNSWNITL
jgi:hypothetical protein